ncbi:HdeD family acid-resistance protein [Acetobacteraceae bacterium]|nr:HdeD family acid-resistance protein [Acetobacteraceae bacterium]
MSFLTESDITPDQILKAEIGSLLKVNPAWFIGCGIALLILGLLALGAPVFLTLASTVLLGVCLIIGGVVQLVMGFAHSASYYLRYHAHRWESILTGTCLLIGGLLMCVQPVAGAIFVTAFLGALFIFSGIGQIFVAIHSRHAPGYAWVLFGGVITAFLGVVLFLNLNGASLQFLGFLIAMELLMLGFVALSYGLCLRGLHKKHGDDETYLL